MRASEIRAALPTIPDGMPADEGFWLRLHAAYAATPRHYHTFEHVCAVAGWYAQVARDVGWQRPREVFCAVLFHDAVYVVGVAGIANERDSAALARAELAAAGAAASIDADRVAQLIELTAAHGRLGPGDVDADAALFLDCDMAILGAAPDAFARYEQAVAREYLAVIPEAAYAAGRRRFLGAVLAADRIFLSDYFHARLDAAARRNLRGSLAAMGG